MYACWGVGGSGWLLVLEDVAIHDEAVRFLILLFSALFCVASQARTKCA